MISPRSHEKEWIKAVTQEQFPKTDPSLAERVIYALTLLEKLKGAKIDFVFKGGTALLLSMGDLDRFSVDIDVVMPTKPADLASRFDEIVKSGNFTRYEEDVRENRLAVQKAHYRFYFDSVIQAKPAYILLDIIFDKPTYLDARAHPLESAFVVTAGDRVEIMVPSFEGLMSDKLTTLASDTVGIELVDKNDLQIAKQLYDVARLFDRISDIAKVRAELEALVPVEAAYKKLKNPPAVVAVLEECYDFALVVGFRGKHKPERHATIKSGVVRLKNYLLRKKSEDEALMWAGKVAYSSRLLITGGGAIQRFDATVDMKTWSIVDQKHNQLNRIKNMSLEGFFYWYQAIRLAVGPGAVAA